MATQIVNISIPKKLLQEADRVAEAESRTRSELIRESLRDYVERRKRWEELLEYGRRKGRELGIKSEKDVYRMVEEYRQGK